MEASESSLLLQNRLHHQASQQPMAKFFFEIKKSHLQRQLNAINVIDFFIFKSFRKYELSKL